MLELYHSINSVCAQKVRIALKEKGLEAKEHLMTLAGDQFDPAYMKLNPSAVVPTLVHDGVPIVESSVILYYIDEAFPEPALMPREPRARAQVRLYNKLVDEYVHNSCMVLSFATAFRGRMVRMSEAAREEEFRKTPIAKRAEMKRDVVLHGLDSHFVADAVAQHDKLLSWIEAGSKTGPYLAGEKFSLADAAVIPYMVRLDLLRLSHIWENRPGVAAWWERVKNRPSTQETIYRRMTEADAAPFKQLDLDPWPKVKTLLAAA
jgi:glutathione S-transferase